MAFQSELHHFVFTSNDCKSPWLTRHRHFVLLVFWFGGRAKTCSGISFYFQSWKVWHAANMDHKELDMF